MIKLKYIKGSGQSLVKILSWNLLRGTEGNTKELQLEEPVTWPMFEPRISRKHSRDFHFAIAPVLLKSHMTVMKWTKLTIMTEASRRVISLNHVRGQS
jgi:hypothetical protein